VHALYGHGLENVRFDMAGELQAFKRHARALLTARDLEPGSIRILEHEVFVRSEVAAAIRVLFTEVVGQAAVESAYGFFDVKRAAYLFPWNTDGLERATRHLHEEALRESYDIRESEASIRDINNRG
jgi:hypothetical protein